MLKFLPNIKWLEIVKSLAYFRTQLDRNKNFICIVNNYYYISYSEVLTILNIYDGI